MWGLYCLHYLSTQPLSNSSGNLDSYDMSALSLHCVSAPFTLMMLRDPNETSRESFLLFYSKVSLLSYAPLLLLGRLRTLSKFLRVWTETTWMAHLSLSLSVDSIGFQFSEILKIDGMRLLRRCVGYPFLPFVLGKLTNTMRALDNLPHILRTAGAFAIQMKMSNMLTLLSTSFCVL